MKIFVLLLSIVALVSSAVPQKNPICGLEHAKDGFGYISCNAFLESWSYKPETNECVRFVYGGCGGNLNRFKTLEACEETCKV